jgi:GT2 family glycosyltransferase
MIQNELVEVVVVTYNSARHIRACIESIAAAGALPVVVDNNSTDDTLEIVRLCCPEAKIIASDKNLGYGRAMNVGFRETKSDFVILSNPDVVYLDNSIARLAEFLKKHPGVGITAPQQIYPDRSWQQSYGDLLGVWSGIKDAVGIRTLRNVVRRVLWPRKVDRKPKVVPYVDGAVLAVRREAFVEMGGFDEDFFFYGEESDLCARLRKAAWGVVFFPAAEVIHIRGGSSVTTDRSDRFVRYMVKSQSLLASKHLPRWKARVYAKLQICHFIRLGLMYRVLRFLEGEKGSTSYKIWMFDAYTRIWKEFSESPHLIHTPITDSKPNECKETMKAN